MYDGQWDFVGQVAFRRLNQRHPAAIHDATGPSHHRCGGLFASTGQHPEFHVHPSGEATDRSLARPRLDFADHRLVSNW